MKAGGDPEQVAKSLGLDAKTSDLFSRTGNVAGHRRRRPCSGCVYAACGPVQRASLSWANWVVYRVDDRQQANPDDMAKQQPRHPQQLLDQKHEMAFEAFRTALENRIQQEGKLQYNQDALKRLTTPT